MGVYSMFDSGVVVRLNYILYLKSKSIRMFSIEMKVENHVASAIWR